MFLKIARQGRNDWWRYLFTIVLTIGALTLFSIPLIGVGAFYYTLKYGSDVDQEEMMEYLETMNYTEIGISLNSTVFLALLSFVGGLIALWFFLRILHHRNLKTLITPLDKIKWSKVFFAFFLWLLFAFVTEGIAWLISPGDYILQFEWQSFVPLLLISLLILPLQTTFEEVFFRGYLMQGIAMISTYRIVPLLVTSLLFGAMHIANPEIEKFGTWIMMAYYIGMGLFLGFITLMDDSLELAVGIHAATNFFASTFVTFEGSALQTNAIFRTDVFNIELMLPIFFATAAIFIFICRKKYKWVGWQRALGKIKLNDLDDLTQVELNS